MYFDFKFYFCFVSDYGDEHRCIIVSDCVSFQDICVKIFSLDRSNRAKVETFPLLAQVYVITVNKSLLLSTFL